MKQKMAIARGLLNDPKTLFMDEPTRSLDPNAAREIRDFIKNEAIRGKTIFLTTHNLHEADELCDRVAIIDKGKLKSQGSLKELRKIIGEEVVVNIDVKKDSAFTYLDEKIEKQKLSEDFMRLKIKANRNALPEIITNIVSARGKIVACNTEEPSLEEVFDKLTRGNKND
jgi:ABC-2 type transport system ATP-binding protein